MTTTTANEFETYGPVPSVSWERQPDGDYRSSDGRFLITATLEPGHVGPPGYRRLIDHESVAAAAQLVAEGRREPHHIYWQNHGGGVRECQRYARYLLHVGASREQVANYYRAEDLMREVERDAVNHWEPLYDEAVRREKLALLLVDQVKDEGAGEFAVHRLLSLAVGTYEAELSSPQPVDLAGVRGAIAGYMADPNGAAALLLAALRALSEANCLLKVAFAAPLGVAQVEVERHEATISDNDLPSYRSWCDWYRQRQG